MRRFRPLIRGFFFYEMAALVNYVKNLIWFPSPHSGILFLCLNGNAYTFYAFDSFRPLIRGFFFYLAVALGDGRYAVLVSVPSFGDSFFISEHMLLNVQSFNPVSVPSFGDSFFIFKLVKKGSEFVITARFRPLIRGFFFYSNYFIMLLLEIIMKFPSPHSGILFLFFYEDAVNGIEVVVFPSPHSGILFLLLQSAKRLLPGKVESFRPLIRGFFFYFAQCDSFNAVFQIVSVPSFGDSFFIPVVMICRQV